jgi:hypothetical protein
MPSSTTKRPVGACAPQESPRRSSVAVTPTSREGHRPPSHNIRCMPRCDGLKLQSYSHTGSKCLKSKSGLKNNASPDGSFYAVLAAPIVETLLHDLGVGAVAPWIIYAILVPMIGMLFDRKIDVDPLVRWVLFALIALAPILPTRFIHWTCLQLSCFSAVVATSREGQRLTERAVWARTRHMVGYCSSGTIKYPDRRFPRARRCRADLLITSGYCCTNL